ncbi:histidine phosphatase superfamily-domain-containing protein, partial [Chytriomyces sp. MP71]
MSSLHIGEHFAHAETRKSPVVDGLVRRNSEGKEVRYMTPLRDKEKVYSSKVCCTFGQTVCGFDPLRAGGNSCVLDVNGWSFVKGNLEYYDMCARILSDLFTSVSQLPCVSNPVTTSVSTQWKLKAFLSVMRHGDRTPKQKFKFNFKSKPFMDLLNGAEEELVLKSEEQLKVVSAACDAAIAAKCEDENALASLRAILDFKSSLPGTKVQIKPSYSKTNKNILEKAQLIVKWGGEITHSGMYQSKDFGENLRKDLNIINQELLDDVRFYSSSERRVIATSEIMAKALLDLPKLPSDLVTINKEMLDDSNAAKEQIEGIKGRLQEVLNPYHPTKLAPEHLPKTIEDPEKYLADTISVLRQAREVMRKNLEKGGEFSDRKDKWCCLESPFLFQERWEKLFKEFCDIERNAFEPSKISELYDSIKYDILHNRDFLDIVFFSEEQGDMLLRQIYHKAKVLFDFIGPQEYGIEPKEKLDIGILSSASLLKQLVSDLVEAKNSPRPCSRIYFTKESKVICLFNIVLLCGLPTILQIGDIDELDYLTQITFELHERKSAFDKEESEYSLRIGFSPGAHDPNLMDLHLDEKHTLKVAPRKWI